MNLLAPLVRRPDRPESRYTTNDYANWVSQALGFGSFSYQGSTYPVGVNTTVPGTKTESIPSNFGGFTSAGLKGNGIVFTLEQVRVQVFTQARFQWQALRKGRPGELFSTPGLQPLETPWKGGTTGELLARMIIDADLAGNSYGVLTDGMVLRLRPDWTDIVVAELRTARGVVGYELAGYIYWHEGRRDGPATSLLPDEVAHFAPMPDPMANFRGMSWLTPTIRDLMGDQAYSSYKQTFIDNAATPNLAITLKEAVTQPMFDAFVDMIDRGHRGQENAGKTLFLNGGADVTVIGADMQQLDFKVVQGATETRLAAASGVGAVIAQFSEGMQGSSLNAGNYGASRRRFADVTMRHLWQEAAGALAAIVDAPAGSRLWYDARDISFLQEDAADAANIRQTDSIALRNLVDAGFDADAAVAYLVSGGDLSLLMGKHSGLFSVQLQEPGSSTTSAPATEATPEEVPNE